MNRRSGYLALALAGALFAFSLTPAGAQTTATSVHALRALLSKASSTTGAALVGFLQTGTGASSRTVQAKLREFVSVTDFGADGVGDDTAQLQAAVDAAGSSKILHVPAGDYSFTALTIAGDMTFSGNGRLVGAATSGAKPTRADLTGAANSAARLTDLQDYYNGEVTFSADAVLRGELSLKDCLLRKSGGSGIEIRGDVTFNNVSAHALQIQATRNGYLDATGLISSDSNGVGLYVDKGGLIEAPSSIVVFAASRGLMVLWDGVIRAGSSEIWNSGTQGVYTNFGGIISVASSTISDSGGAGILINYGGQIDAQSAIVDDSGAGGVTAESNGSVYIEGGTITDSTGTGLQTVRGGVIQAAGATITGNSSFAAYANTGGNISVLTATIDLTNNGGGSNQILRAIGEGIIITEGPGGSGKAALAAANYYPAFNAFGQGAAYIGLASQNDSLVYAPGLTYGPYTSVTIATDDITIGTTSWYRVDTEAAAATDNLDTIVGGEAGRVVVLQSNNSARDVVVKHNGAGAGSSILLNGSADFTLSHPRDTLTLIKDVDGTWKELARADNAA